MNIPVYINYATAILTFVFGIILVSGIIETSNRNTYLMFGIILIIYGIYRFISTTSKVKQQKMIDRLDELKTERDKLFGKK